MTNPRTMPADFPAVAQTMSRSRLVKHYRTGGVAINRWIAELPAGTQVPTFEVGMKGVSRKGRGPSMLAKFDSDTQNRTYADLAAMHLQRRFVPVCRATVYDKRLVGVWQVGRLKMPETEMVALARKQGWS